MEHETTMPSILGPQSGYGTRYDRAASEKPEPRNASPVLKIVVFAVLAVLLIGAYRFFAR